MTRAVLRFAPEEIVRRMKTKLYVKYLDGKRMGYLQVRRQPAIHDIDNLVAALLRSLHKAGLPTERNELFLKVRREIEFAPVYDGLLLTPKTLAYFICTRPEVGRKEVETHMLCGLAWDEFYRSHCRGDLGRLLLMDVLPQPPKYPRLVGQFWSEESGLFTPDSGCLMADTTRN